MNLMELKIARIRKELTQKELAEKLGMAEVSYNRKEQGIREFSREEIEKLALLLNLDMDKVNEIFFNGKLTDCNIKE